MIWVRVGSVSLYATLLLVVSCVLSAYLLPPFMVQSTLKKALGELNLSLGDAIHVRYNPIHSFLQFEDLVLLHRGVELVSVKSVKFDLSLYNVFWEWVPLTELRLDGLSIKVDKVGDEYSVAGLRFSDAGDAFTQWYDFFLRSHDFSDVGSSIIFITNSQLFFPLGGESQVFDINALTLSDALLTKRRKTLVFSLEGRFQKALIKLKSEIEWEGGEGFVSSDVDISGMDVVFIQPYLEGRGLELASGLFSAHGSPRLTVDRSGVEISLTGMGFKLDDFYLRVDK